MIKRIVKMEFKKEGVAPFIELFKSNKTKIGAFDGCHSVQLMGDVNDSNIFFTYSLWETEQHLQQYRESETFKLIWSKTKPLFSTKAKAWSLEEI